MKLSVAALFAAALVVAVVPAWGQTYSVQDLGAVAGDSVSQGYGLNDLGQAAGVSSKPTGDIPTLFGGGRAINLGTLVNGDIAVATGINKSAEVVGYEFEYATGGDGVAHGVLYSNGRLYDIHSPSLFPQGTRAAVIDGSGVVVGQGYLTASTFHLFVYSGGQITDIGPPGAFQATPTGINDAGQIIGSAAFDNGSSGTFVYSNGAFTYLTPPAGTTASAQAINGTGQIAGTIFFDNGSPAHAASYANGVWTDLGGVTGASATHGTGINGSGQVIATAYYPVQSYHPFIPGKHVAYIVRNGALVNLNTLIPANSGFTLTDAMAINTPGQILCDAKNSSGTVRAVLLSLQTN